MGITNQQKLERSPTGDEEWVSAKMAGACRSNHASRPVNCKDNVSFIPGARIGRLTGTAEECIQ